MKTEAIEHQIEVYRGYAATYPKGSSERDDCTEAADQMESELKAIETALAAKDGELRAIRMLSEDSGEQEVDLVAMMEAIKISADRALSPPTGKVLVSLEELREIEWDSIASCNHHDRREYKSGCCPVCEGDKLSGHAAYCWIGNLLKEATNGQS